jgi:hypothetical protein
MNSLSSNYQCSSEKDNMNFASPLTDSDIETILIASGVSKRKRHRSLNLLTSEYVSKIRKTAEGHLKSWFKSGVPTCVIWNKLPQDESPISQCIPREVLGKSFLEFQ